MVRCSLGPEASLGVLLHSADHTVFSHCLFVGPWVTLGGESDFKSDNILSLDVRLELVLDPEVLHTIVLVVGSPGLDLPLDTGHVEKGCSVLSRVRPGTDILCSHC